MADLAAVRALGDPALGTAVAEWFGDAARDLPWRAEGFGAWGVLVSEIMLQQTQVDRVIPRLAAWLERWPTPADLAASPPSEAVRMWDRLGYPRRALRLHACASVIAEEHGNVVPDDVDALLALPGIGDYTARAVAVFAYRQRHPVVDTNTRRVIARAVLGQAEPGPPHKRDLADMTALLPEDVAASTVVNAGMMELGALICTARSPRCDVCPIADRCAWRAAGYTVYDGPVRQKQARFEGSDRQARGRIMAALRGSEVPVPKAELLALAPDAAQLERALAGLVADGLATGDPASGYALPDS